MTRKRIPVPVYVPEPWMIDGLEKLRREQSRERPRAEMPAPPPPEVVHT